MTTLVPCLAFAAGILAALSTPAPAIAPALAPAGQPGGGPDVINFEGIDAGTILSEVYGAGGAGPVVVTGFNPDLGAVNAAVIFDSSAPTGEDFDLGTPNEDFGGPGIGDGGSQGSPFENSHEHGNLLIIAEDLVDGDGDGLVDDPDDADVLNSRALFDFTSLGTVALHSLLLVDVEADEPIALVEFFDALGDPLGMVELPAVGDNGVGEFDLGNVEGVTFALVTLNGSGAIDEIVFTPAAECTGSIGDFVWHDLNQDGLQGDGEPGIPGVDLILKDARGAVIGTTTSSDTGAYGFEGLCAGSYSVEVDASTLPAKFVPTHCMAGDDPTIDNNCSPAAVVLPHDDSHDPTIDFGYIVRDMGDDDGCTPGYWKQKQHFDSWPAGLLPETLFSDVFEDAFPGQTLLDGLKLKGGGLNALGRHTVAALLNAESDEVNYFELTGSDVVEMFNAVYPGTKAEYTSLKNHFAAMNEEGCPLN